MLPDLPLNIQLSSLGLLWVLGLVFGDEGEFPPLTSGSPFLAVALPPSPCRLFDDLMALLDMDSLSLVSSE